MNATTDTPVICADCRCPCGLEYDAMFNEWVSSCCGAAVMAATRAERPLAGVPGRGEAVEAHHE